MLASHGPTFEKAPRILLIDDEDLLTFCIEIELAATGHQVRTAHTLKMASEALGTFAPDLVICDQGLPDGWGSDFVKGLDPWVPVIMITAFSPPRLDSSRVRRILLKPFDLKVLTEEVEKQLRASPSGAAVEV